MRENYIARRGNLNLADFRWADNTCWMALNPVYANKSRWRRHLCSLPRPHYTHLKHTPLLFSYLKFRLILLSKARIKLLYIQWLLGVGC